MWTKVKWHCQEETYSYVCYLCRNVNTSIFSHRNSTFGLALCIIWANVIHKSLQMPCLLQSISSRYYNQEFHLSQLKGIYWIYLQYIFSLLQCNKKLNGDPNLFLHLILDSIGSWLKWALVCPKKMFEPLNYIILQQQLYSKM